MTGAAAFWSPSGFAGYVGIARREITPPPGIFVRCWGPARHDVATGVHRPLTLTALVLSADLGGEPLILLSADLSWWRAKSDELHVRGAVIDTFELRPANVLLHATHTHAGPSICADDIHQPGGELVPPYLDALRAAAVSAADEALASAEEVTLVWGVGRCGLAANRDLPVGDRFVVGFNPEAPADDTLLVGRITDSDGKIVATIINYACHPTTLGWQNTLVSPDFLGATREMVEEVTGAPCIFLQGASGELAPREQYVEDVGVADRHGRTLAYAALSVLEALPPPGTGLAFDGVVESGAPLGMWRPRRRSFPDALRAQLLTVNVEVKELPSLRELAERWARIDERSLSERLTRARQRNELFGSGGVAPYPVWLWHVGDAVVIAHPGEAYSYFQVELRRRFPTAAIIVMNVTNGPGPVYLPPADAYDHDAYPVWQTPLARGSLERILEATAGAVADELGSRRPSEGRFV